MTKIAVYTIALNEEKHVKRWYESAKQADLLLIADTGSTDRTIELAEELGIKVYQVKVDPWRFDVARNASLALVPESIDICIQLDMDEILPADWRPKVEKAWEEGNTWPIYKHVTSRYPDGSARSYQHYFKIHPRKGFIWKYPIHEIVTPQEGISFQREVIDLEVDHIQDHSKSRKSYLHLLQTAVREAPDDWRMLHYLNREYWYNKDWNEVINTAYQAMKFNHGWDVERASTFMWASDSAVNLGFKDWALEWARRATEAAPQFYEAWHWRAHISFLLNSWEECYDSASKILTLTRQHHHLVKPEVWDWWGWDLLALGAYNTRRYEEAIQYGEKAIIGSPETQRLHDNMKFYKRALVASDNNSRLHSKTLELISLITPTRDREIELQAQYSRLLRQTHSNWEWLIADDSPTPSDFFSNIADSRVKYRHNKTEQALSIGEKRNSLIKEAQGEWIAHIDDDDFYGPDYLKFLLSTVGSRDIDLLYLKSWHFINEKFELGRYSSDSVLPRLEGWGFTYLYRKALTAKYKFPDNNWEDHFWFQEVTQNCNYLGIEDTYGYVFKLVHSSNTSRFPWGLTKKLSGEENLVLETRFAKINSIPKNEITNSKTSIDTFSIGYHLISINEIRAENKKLIRKKLSHLEPITIQSFNGSLESDQQAFTARYPNWRLGEYRTKAALKTLKHRRNGEIGCWMSHYHAWATAASLLMNPSNNTNGTTHLLIAEDDIQIPENLNFNELLTISRGIDVLMLGDHTGLYLINRIAAEYLKDHGYENGFLSRPVDEYFLDLMRWAHRIPIRIAILPLARPDRNLISVIDHSTVVD